MLAASAAGVCQACKDPRFKKKSVAQLVCVCRLCMNAVCAGVEDWGCVGVGAGVSERVCIGVMY